MSLPHSNQSWFYTFLALLSAFSGIAIGIIYIKNHPPVKIEKSCGVINVWTSPGDQKVQHLNVFEKTILDNDPIGVIGSDEAIEWACAYSNDSDGSMWIKVRSNQIGEGWIKVRLTTLP